MLIITIRIAGYYTSGEFSLVISFTNIFGFLSAYNIRSFQLNDVHQRFSPQQYSCAYVLTSLFSVICFSVSLPLCGYTLNVFSCCIAFMLFKLCETFTTYIFTYMQLKNNYSGILISLILKGIIPLISFSLCLFLTNSLFYSIIALFLFYFSTFVMYDLPKTKEYLPHAITMNGTREIIIKCFPLMLSTLFTPFILFITRYTIEKIYGIVVLGFFTPFTMVIIVFFAIAESVYIVLLPTISIYYAENLRKELNKFILLMIGCISIFCIIALLFAHFLGDFLFSFIFGIEILPYMYLLIPTIFAGIILVILSLLSTLLIAIRKHILMLICKVFGSILLYILIVPATQSFGILGTINAFSLSLGIPVIIQSIIIFFNICTKTANIQKSDKAKLFDNTRQ